GYSGAGGNANGSAVTNLKVGGQPAGDAHVALGDWGQLTIGSQGVDRSAPDGTHGYRGFVTEIDIHLTADHGGLPASSEIQIGYADVAVQTAPPASSGETTTTTETTPGPSPAQPSVPDSPSDPPRHQGARPPPALPP